MKKLPLLLALLMAFGAAAIMIWQVEVNAQLRQTIAGLRSEFAAQDTRVESTKVELEKVRAQNDVYRDESEALRKKIAAKPVPSDEAKAGANEPASENNFLKKFAKMFTDPETKKAMRSQQGMVVRMMYGDLAKELGLTPDEANQVMEILIDRQMALAAQSMGMMSGGKLGPDKLEELGKAAAARKQEYDLQLKAIIGEGRQQQFQSFESSLGDRMQMQQIQQSLSATGVSLEEKQRSALLEIMKQERASTPPSVFQPGNSDVAAQMKAMQSGDGFAQTVQNAEKFNQRVLARARTVLSPDQMLGFESAQKQQLDMMQMGFKMSREMMKPAGGSPP